MIHSCWCSHNGHAFSQSLLGLDSICWQVFASTSELIGILPRGLEEVGRGPSTQSDRNDATAKVE